jgi:hypothetical protein
VKKHSEYTSTVIEKLSKFKKYTNEFLESLLNDDENAHKRYIYKISQLKSDDFNPFKYLQSIRLQFKTDYVLSLDRQMELKNEKLYNSPIGKSLKDLVIKSHMRDVHIFNSLIRGNMISKIERNYMSNTTQNFKQDLKKRMKKALSKSIMNIVVYEINHE